MKKLLLTGASGFLGWNICRAGSASYEIHGVAHSTIKKIPEVFIHPCDLTDASAVRKLFSEINPDSVIHAAAVSDANYCQQHPQETFTINVSATILLAQLCADKNIPFVFVSSDLVFDGKKGNYNEAHAVNPVSKYGEQKAEAEREILKLYPQAAICRMPLMIGNAGTEGKGYLQWFISRASKGESLKLFTDEYRSPLGGESAAKGLLHALKNFKGIYHLGGREKLSRFELGLKIADAFDIPHSLMIPSEQNEMTMAAPRPPDVSLNSSKAFSEGFSPETIEEELKKLAPNAEEA